MYRDAYPASTIYVTGHNKRHGEFQSPPRCLSCLNGENSMAWGDEGVTNFNLHRDAYPASTVSGIYPLALVRKFQSPPRCLSCLNGRWLAPLGKWVEYAVCEAELRNANFVLPQQPSFFPSSVPGW